MIHYTKHTRLKKKSSLMMLLLCPQVNSINYSLIEAAEATVVNATGRSLLSAQLKGTHK